MAIEATSPERAEAIWNAGRARFPDVCLEASALAEHLRTLERHGDDPDLYLACACSLDDRTAHEVLERYVFTEVSSYIGRVDSSAEGADEIRQQLRERLLVRRTAEPARIAEYAGLGPLGAWVRVAALRLAIERAGSPQHVELSEVPALASPQDPELALIRGRYQDAYQAAVRDAIASLKAKDRTLLRLSVVDGLSIDRLAQIYSVHRASAARWVNQAKACLLEETYRLLGERLHLPEADLQSLAPLLRSQLHLSLARLL